MCGNCIISVLRVHIMDLYIWLKHTGRGERKHYFAARLRLSRSQSRYPFVQLRLEKNKGTHRLKQMVNKHCEITH